MIFFLHRILLLQKKSFSHVAFCLRYKCGARVSVEVKPIWEIRKRMIKSSRK